MPSVGALLMQSRGGGHLEGGRQGPTPHRSLGCTWAIRNGKWASQLEGVGSWESAVCWSCGLPSRDKTHSLSNPEAQPC